MRGLVDGRGGRGQTDEDVLLEGPPPPQICLLHGDQMVGEQDIMLRMLRPRAGRYLPVTACLDGVLAVAPKGYLPTQHDSVRLVPEVDKARAQDRRRVGNPLIMKMPREMPPVYCYIGVVNVCYF